VDGATVAMAPPPILRPTTDRPRGVMPRRRATSVRAELIWPCEADAQRGAPGVVARLLESVVRSPRAPTAPRVADRHTRAPLYLGYNRGPALPWTGAGTTVGDQRHGHLEVRRSLHVPAAVCGKLTRDGEGCRTYSDTGPAWCLPDHMGFARQIPETPTPWGTRRTKS
jgi:hypothetical protein